MVELGVNMVDLGLHRATLRALDRARPDGIERALREVLATHWGPCEVRLLLADYQLTQLRSIDDSGDSVMLDDGEADRAFQTQLPVVSTSDRGEENVYLPVTVHGDRMGVLQLTSSNTVSSDRLDELTDLATLTGYTLSVTSRHTDFLHRAVRSGRLPLAAELQRQLLPAHGCRVPEYELAGRIEPASGVYADNFDWSDEAENLIICVTDHTQGAKNHPLLTTLAVTAIRNARRAELSIAQQFAMADQAVYAHYRGDLWVSALVLAIDVATGHVRVIKAGSPQAIVVRHDEIRTIDLTDQMPLGMFEETEYSEQSFDLVPGDRLVLLSDGVLDAVSSCGERYRDNRLFSLLGSMDQHGPTAVVRAIIDDLIEHHESDNLDDDATVVCLDWSGVGAVSILRPTESDSDDRRATRLLQAVPQVNDLSA